MSKVTQCPGAVLGAGHTGTPCLACTDISRLPESRCSAQPQGLCEEFRHSEPLMSVLEQQERLQKSKFPDACQGPASQAGLSKDNGLQTAHMGTITISHFTDKQRRAKEVK